MPGFVVNGNQYTSGRNVIMGKETPTSWVRAIQDIKDLRKENDNFVLKNAELLEEVEIRRKETETWRKETETWRKETVMVRQEMIRRRTVYDEARKEFASVNHERDKLILVQIKQIEELNDWKQKYIALAHPETKKNYWTRDKVSYELRKWQRELEKLDDTGR
jgi:chromosome segregation ATPase